MTETNSLSEVGWLADRGIRSGRCRNDFYCLLANTNRTQRIKSGESFICPECLKPLKEVTDPGKPPQTWRNAWFVIGSGVAATALYLLVALPYVADQPAIPKFVIIPSAYNPTSLQSIAIAPQMVDRPLSARSLANQPVIAYRTLAQAITLPPRASLQAVPAPAHSTQNRGFSAEPIAGGEPAFPDSAQNQRITGLVRVTCRIETNGAPDDCQASAVRGGRNYSNAVSSWLKSGSVRFAPILERGQPMAEIRSWDIEFSPDLQKE